MVAASKIALSDSEIAQQAIQEALQDKKVDSEKAETFDWSLIWDWTELVAPTAFVTGLVAFTHSARGKKFLASYVDAIPDKDKLARTLFFSANRFFHVPSYYLPILVFSLIDLTHYPKFIYDLRLQPKKDPPRLFKLLYTITWAIIVQAAVAGTIVRKIIYPLWKKKVTPEYISTMPSALRSIYEFVACEFLAELFFYVTHRLFHQKYLYKWVHKWHHVNTSPFTACAIFANPLDVALSNVITVLLPVGLVGVHPTTFWFYNAWRNWHGTLIHAGYDIPFGSDTRSHDWHHRTFESNYGINAGILGFDTLFGTGKPFLKWLAKHRKEVDFITHQKLEKAMPDAEAEAKQA